MSDRDVREQGSNSALDEEKRQVEREALSSGERLEAGGGLRYQQAHRAAGVVHDGGSKATAGARSEIARETSAPAQDQRAEHHGGPGPDDEAQLGEHGYPKLGKAAQSRVTQVEHGPYAGGTQQGDAETREKAERRG